MVVQIIAHLPLTDVYLPSHLHEAFKVMISAVSFDYFPPFNYIEVDFTEVWSWSPNFEWLGYDSVNFILGLGSIAVFAVIQLALVLIWLILKVFRLRCPCEWGRQTFSGSSIWLSSLEFIHGTFFEIIVCISISMSMLTFTEFLKTSDKVSIAFSLFSAAFVIAYIILVSYFVCCRSKQLSEFHKAKEEERNLQRTLKFYHKWLL